MMLHTQKALDDYFRFALKLNDDYGLMADFMIKYSNTKLKRGAIIGFLEQMRFHKLEDEIEICLKLDDDIYNKFIPKGLFDEI